MTDFVAEREQHEIDWYERHLKSAQAQLAAQQAAIERTWRPEVVALRAQVARLDASLEVVCADRDGLAIELATLQAELAATRAVVEALDPRLPFRSRGIGSDWTPGCFVCGGEKELYSNISGFVQSKAEGEQIVALFKHGAYLDYREFEPNWIQVKVGACKKHVDVLSRLSRATVDANGTINRRLLLDAQAAGAGGAPSRNEIDLMRATIHSQQDLIERLQVARLRVETPHKEPSDLAGQAANNGEGGSGLAPTVPVQAAGAGEQGR